MSNIRNDAYLYTGINSVSNEPKTPRELQKESKEEAKRKLKPAAEVVLEAIEKERQAVCDIRTLVMDSNPTEQEANTELIARQKFLAYLNGLESKIKTIMADKPKKRGEGANNG